MSDRLYEDYDRFADRYVEATRTNAANAGYERPAIRALVGDVTGRDVLDAGCAGGEHSIWLAQRGARVVAVDANARMVELARERAAVGVPQGDDDQPEGSVAVRLHDLNEPLPFADGAFDLVFSSLTIHYMREWESLFREFHRVARPDAALVLSTHHPQLGLEPGGDYFGTTLIEDRWSGFGDEPVRVRFWRRPLEAMLTPLHAAGWRLTDLREPRFEASPSPMFLFLRLVRSPQRAVP